MRSKQYQNNHTHAKHNLIIRTLSHLQRLKFTERLALVKADRFSRLAPVKTVEPNRDVDSFFKERLLVIVDRNLSGDCERFSRAVSHLCHTLPQLLFNKDRIVEVILDFLQTKNLVYFDVLRYVVDEKERKKKTEKQQQQALIE
jgi:hypothetical protein